LRFALCLLTCSSPLLAASHRLTFRPLLTAYCPLLTAHCLLPTAYSLAWGGSLGGQRYPSGEPDISCFRYPPRSQRRREVKQIASPAGICPFVLSIGGVRQNLNSLPLRKVLCVGGEFRIGARSQLIQVHALPRATCRHALWVKPVQEPVQAMGRRWPWRMVRIWTLSSLTRYRMR